MLTRERFHKISWSAGRCTPAAENLSPRVAAPEKVSLALRQVCLPSACSKTEKRRPTLFCDFVNQSSSLPDLRIRFRSTLPIQSSNPYVHACVRAHVRGCSCVRERVRVGVRACARARVHACARARGHGEEGQDGCAGGRIPERRFMWAYEPAGRWSGGRGVGIK